MYENGFWVFGYGSLLWQPGFEFTERKRARLSGFSRAFCMYSITYRGTPENPGLVLALNADDTAYCDGLAFQVPKETAPETIAYLRERELISSAYLEQKQTVTLDDGANVSAVCYVIDRSHVQYTGGLGLETQADIIARSTGRNGPNWDYLKNTAAHLAELDIADAEMEKLVELVKLRRGSRD